MKYFPIPNRQLVASVLGLSAALQIGCKGPLDDEDGLVDGAVPPVGQPVAGLDGGTDQAIDPNAIDAMLNETALGAPSPLNPGVDVAAIPTIAYTIQKGDTLSQIAEMHGTNIATIQQLNGLKGSFIRYGDSIKVPAPAGTAAGEAVATDVPAGTGTVPPVTAPETPAPPSVPPTIPTPPSEPESVPGSVPESRLDGSGLGFGGASAPRPRTPPRSDNEFLSPELPE